MVQTATPGGDSTVRVSPTTVGIADWRGGVGSIRISPGQSITQTPPPEGSSPAGSPQPNGRVTGFPTIRPVAGSTRTTTGGVWGFGSEEGPSVSGPVTTHTDA